MVYFSSTAICAADYSAQTQVLRIQFTSGSTIYDYPGVPRHIWDGLLNAPSQGIYYNVHIRDVYAAR